jgi:hypothetical protein
VNEQSPPPVGDDPTALVLSVLRDTVRAHEATIAALTEAALGHAAEVEHYQRERQRLGEAHYRECNRLKDLVHAERVRGMRAEKERDQVVDALRALAQIVALLDNGSLPDRFVTAVSLRLREAREVLAVIDAQKPT